MSALDPLLLAACAAVGAGAGFLGGLLGIGGGVVIVPALLLLFEARGMPASSAAPVAVATSLATIIATSVSAARAQIRRASVDWGIVRAWTPALVLGSAASGPLASLLPGAVLPWFIGLFLFAVALVMLSAWTPAPHRRLPGGAPGFGLGASAGLLSGLAGIGGGNVIVPTFVYFNVPMRMAAGTSSTLGFPIAVAGTIGFLVAGHGRTDLPAGTLGYVHLPAAGALAVLSFAAAPLGVALAHRIPAPRLKRIFGVLLVVVSSRVLWGAFAAL
ncbi:MAG: sulfite exporter TauE/SafE family protein [Pseudomonadales bacterium]|jgi:uncharacterized membrane protein YfcA|nr:sulfite exporter TauE/SafE family protein [Pseudomonadales bacterium]